jgi:hypothetical protein
MFVGQLLPEPTDALYFYILKWLNTDGILLDKFTYYFILLFSYYVLPALCYLVYLAYFVITDIKPNAEMFKFVGIISLGGVIGVVLSLWLDCVSLLEAIISTIAVFVVSFICIYAVDKMGSKKKRFNKDR